MSASSKVIAIKLTEDDVPGAKLRSSQIEEHSVVELKRWLQCRGLPAHGTKPDLVKRCLNCIEAKQDSEIIISVDGGAWYQKKVSRVLSETCQDTATVPVLPVTGWGKFPSKTIPEGFSYGTIYDHIIATAVLCNADGKMTTTDFGTTKPMTRGRQFFTSGHVKNILDNLHNNCYFVKSSVMASYKIAKLRSVTVTIDCTSAKVIDASCDCEASSMSRCSHVAALLFALEDYTLQFGHKPPSSTSLLCKWNVGRKTKRNPKPCHAASYSKKLKPDRIINHEPRPENLTENEETFLNNFVATLPATQGPTMFEQLLEIKYSDYDPDCEFLTNMTHIALTELQSDCRSIPHEIDNTRGQNTSGVWKQQRLLRVTASNAKTVAMCSSKRSQYNFLRRHMWGKDVLDLKSLRYGRENEHKALQVYREKHVPAEFSLDESGFWVNPAYPELGCSPDGLLLNNEGKLCGVVEIKCPLALQNNDPLDIENLPKTTVKNLCYKVQDGTLSLKHNHAYYYQVQMQMAVCNVSYCDFVVWSAKGCRVERIARNPAFWQDLKPRLIDFHHNILVPEYFEMRIPRRLMPVHVNDQ